MRLLKELRRTSEGISLLLHIYVISLAYAFTYTAAVVSTELGDRELHRGRSELSDTSVGAHLVVLIADRSEGLEVSIHEQDVRALNVHERGRGIGESLLRAHAHDVLDALVQKLGGHDHAIRLSVIGDQFEYCSGRHG